jgi:tetratricopeptide (TPR) repeat protein
MAMAKIILLPVKTPVKLGYKRARENKKVELEKKGQLNLFSSPAGNKIEAQIHYLPSRFTPFEEALWLDENNNPGAQEAYLKSILANDCTADSYCNLGILESQTGNIVKAFDCFSQCLKLEERHLEAHYNLANLYFEACDYRLAKLHYELAAEIEPDFPNTYFNLGLVYALNYEYEDAINALFKYKHLVPDEEGKKADNLLNSLRRSLNK